MKDNSISKAGLVLQSKVKVSVVMAAFNEENVIQKAITSICMQSFDNWELIVIDDGSTDDTVSIANSLAERNSRIVVLKNDKNIGLAASLNKGVSLSHGEYIARMDADDVSLPDRLKLQIDYMDNNLDVTVLGGGAVYQDMKGVELGEVMMPETHEAIIAWMLRSSPFIHPTVMARRSFFEKTGGYNESLKRAQDYDLWFRGREIGRYYNLQVPIIRHTQREKRSLRSLCDSFTVRRLHASGIKEISIIMFWLVVELVKRVSRSLYRLAKEITTK